MGPLDGIRVVDFTRFQQGPWATTMLADMGAEVIKLEERLNGDLGRSLGRQADGFCAYFEAHNRGKKSVTVDLRRPEAKEVVFRLLKQSDVLVHNFRPGVMERLGFGYDVIAELNPRIIYASASGFGQHGPLAERPSYDVVAQGMSGIMVTQGGGPDFDPQMAMPGVADQVGAMCLAFGIVAALTARERLGVGQQVDTSLYGSQLSLQAQFVTRALRDGAHANRYESPTFTAYRCRDGKWLTIAVVDPDVYARLCQALHRPDLAVDERFADPFARQRHASLLRDEIRSTICANTREYWLRRLTDHDVACGPVQDYLEVGSDPQALLNGYITTVDHPNHGALRVVGVPATLSRTPGSVGIAPELGQHTEEVLIELGYDWSEIETLKGVEAI